MPKLEDELLKITGDVPIAFLSNNAAKPEDVACVIRSIYTTLIDLARRDPRSSIHSQLPAQKPAVLVSASVSPDFLTCLECGRKFKTLRFHLTKHGMNPDAYRAKWALDREYPLVAAKFAARRLAFAHESRFGFSRKRRRGKGQPTAN